MTVRNFVAKTGELTGLSAIVYGSFATGIVPKLYEMSDIGKGYGIIWNGNEISSGQIALTGALIAGATAGYRALQNYVNRRWP